MARLQVRPAATLRARTEVPAVPQPHPASVEADVLELGRRAAVGLWRESHPVKIARLNAVRRRLIRPRGMQG